MMRIDMIMWKLKSCPRCGGDIAMERDLKGWYENCLQCGYLRKMPNTFEVRQHNGNKEKKELVKLHSQ